MTSTINASTTAGIVTTADTSGVLALQTAGTTAVTVDASQNVGIGTSSPATKLDVAGGVTSTALTIKTTTSTGLVFNDTIADRWQFVNRNDAGDVFQIVSGNINSGGSSIANLTPEGFAFTNIGLGLTTPSTSGTGITFPATQSASSNANTLDDYEEGTWTPAIAGGTTAGTYTYEAARTGGKYTKVGNLVTVWGVIRINTITTAGTGTLLITGLPFTAGSAMASSWANSDAIMVNMYAAGVNASATSYPPPLMGSLSPSVTYVETASFGKNYQISTVIGSLSASSWIYQINGCYTV